MGNQKGYVGLVFGGRENGEKEREKERVIFWES